MNFSRFGTLSLSRPSLGYREFSHPVGFSLGVSHERRISGRFWLVNELSFRSTRTKLAKYTTFGILEQEIGRMHLLFPILIKLQTKRPYFLIGIDAGYLITAKYGTYYQIDQFGETEDITDQLPSAEFSITAGAGQTFKSTLGSLFIEARYSKGMVTHKYQAVGSWRADVLQIFLGIVL